MVKRLLGGFFFAAASVYLSITKIPDLTTVVAVLACAALAGISVTRRSEWSALGGAVLIACSLFLQSALAYRCLDCIRADIMVFSGMICLTAVHRGKLKKALRALTAIVAAMLLITVTLHGGLVETDNAWKVIPVNNMSQHVTASRDDRTISLDTAVRPVVFYSPTCGACAGAVGELIKLDPEGTRWTPVQATGDPAEGEIFLKGMGYKGDVYFSDWGGPVPAMFITRDGKTERVAGPDKMIEIISGGDVN